MSSMETPDTITMRGLSTHTSVGSALATPEIDGYRIAMARKKLIRVSGESLRRRREALGLSQGELERLSGIDQREISRYELEKVKGGEGKSRLIAFLDRMEQLQPRNDNAMTNKRPVLSQVGHGVPGGAYDLPFFRPSLAEGGVMVLPSTFYGQIKRPDYLVDNEKAYALEMIGDAMSPKLEHGDILHVNPEVLPQNGMVCVFLSPNRREVHIFVLVDKTPAAWLVRGALSDAPTQELDRSKWPFCEYVEGVHFSRPK